MERNNSKEMPPPADPPSYMNVLPDELLLLVLGAVEDAATLLDAVPLVCQRWRRLAADPRAWASAEATVLFKRVQGQPTVCAAEARLLLRAPTLSQLMLDAVAGRGKCPCGPDHVSVPLEETLRRSRTTIRGLKLRRGSLLLGNQPVMRTLAGVLDDNRAHLQDLDLFSEEAYVPVPQDFLASLRRCTAVRSLCCPASMATAFECLVGLVELVLEVWEGPRPRGAMPAVGSLPALRSLKVYNYIEENDWMPGWTGRLLVRLCRAAPALEELRVDLCQDAPAALEAAPGLRVVRAFGGPELAAALSELPLRALREAYVEVTCRSFRAAAVAEQQLRDLRAKRPGLRGAARVLVDRACSMRWRGESESDDSDEVTDFELYD